MQPLIDADVLRYEVGFAAEAGWQEEGLPPFDYAAQILDERIRNICAIVDASVPPVLYLTGKGNFRTEIAKRQPYKERPSVKPFHFYNLTAYMQSKYETIFSEGMEADDLMALEQVRRIARRELDASLPETIIVTRDKDLKQVPGWLYSWELNNQPSFGPTLIDDVGHINLEIKIDSKGKEVKKLTGIGTLFFYAQCLMGDPVDCIPGIPKMGPAKAFKILEGISALPEAFEAVREAYRAFFGDDGDRELLEQGRLLWMTRQLNEDGTVVLWEFPIEES